MRSSSVVRLRLLYVCHSLCQTSVPPRIFELGRNVLDLAADVCRPGAMVVVDFDAASTWRERIADRLLVEQQQQVWVDRSSKGQVWMLRQTRPVLFPNRDCATTCRYRLKDVTVRLEMNTSVTIKMRGRSLGFGQQIDGKVGSMKRRHAAATNRKRPSSRIWRACSVVKLLPSFYKLSKNAASDPSCSLLVDHCR